VHLEKEPLYREVKGGGEELEEPLEGEEDVGVEIEVNAREAEEDGEESQNQTRRTQRRLTKNGRKKR
jgi:hypothetical protein